MIQAKFGNSGIAYRSLELLWTSTLRATLEPAQPIDEKWRQVMEQMSKISTEAYLNLIKGDSNFINFFKRNRVTSSSPFGNFFETYLPNKVLQSNQPTYATSFFCEFLMSFRVTSKKKVQKQEVHKNVAHTLRSNILRWAFVLRLNACKTVKPVIMREREKEERGCKRKESKASVSERERKRESGPLRSFVEENFFIVEFLFFF